MLAYALNTTGGGIILTIAIGLVFILGASLWWRSDRNKGKENKE